MISYFLIDTFLIWLENVRLNLLLIVICYHFYWCCLKQEWNVKRVQHSQKFMDLPDSKKEAVDYVDPNIGLMLDHCIHGIWCRPNNIGSMFWLFCLLPFFSAGENCFLMIFYSQAFGSWSAEASHAGWESENSNFGDSQHYEHLFKTSPGTPLGAVSLNLNSLGLKSGCSVLYSYN